MEVDLDEFGIELFCRAKIILNIHKPLRRTQCIKRKDGVVTMVEYKYERLPHFCFRCGVLGHSDKDYSVELPEEYENELGWGAWLKASPHKGRSKNKAEAMAMKARKQIVFVTKEAGATVASMQNKNDMEGRCGEIGGIAGEGGL